MPSVLRVIFFVFVSSFAAVSLSQQHTVQPINPKLSKVIQQQAPFDHTRSEHKLECSYCHLRPNNDPNPVLPYHAACIDCHVSDFTSSTSRLCAVCHQMPLASKVLALSFPDQLTQLGLKGFSHRDHMDTQKMPKETAVPTCRSCHKFDPKELVAGFPSHPECYKCHTHEAGQKLGICETCHALNAEAFKYERGLGAPYNNYKFTHASHLNLKQAAIQYKCEKCHEIKEVLPGTIQADISKIKTILEGNFHTSDCWNCHDKKTGIAQETRAEKVQKEFSCCKCHVLKPPDFVLPCKPGS